MTLNASLPADTAPVADLPSYIRASRAAINAFEASDTEFTVTTLLVSGGETALDVGVDLSETMFEVILITATGAATIEYLRVGTEGQVKIFIFGDNDLEFRDGVKSDGKMYLNQLPALSDFEAKEGDILALINIGGDGDAVYGYWQELFRSIAVK